MTRSIIAWRGLGASSAGSSWAGHGGRAALLISLDDLDPPPFLAYPLLCHCHSIPLVNTLVTVHSDSPPSHSPLFISFFPFSLGCQTRPAWLTKAQEERPVAAAAAAHTAQHLDSHQLKSRCQHRTAHPSTVNNSSSRPPSPALATTQMIAHPAADLPQASHSSAPATVPPRARHPTVTSPAAEMLALVFSRSTSSPMAVTQAASPS